MPTLLNVCLPVCWHTHVDCDCGVVGGVSSLLLPACCAPCLLRDLAGTRGSEPFFKLCVSKVKQTNKCPVCIRKFDTQADAEKCVANVSCRGRGWGGAAILVPLETCTYVCTYACTCVNVCCGGLQRQCPPCSCLKCYTYFKSGVGAATCDVQLKSVMYTLNINEWIYECLSHHYMSCTCTYHVCDVYH